MDLAKQYPDAGRKLPLEMADDRWPGVGGWVKMEQDIDGVEIHYVFNTKTNEYDDFKFKDRYDE